MKVDPLDIMNKFAEWTLSTGPCPINLSASSGQHHHWAKKVAALCDEIAALETKIARMQPVFSAALQFHRACMDGGMVSRGYTGPQNYHIAFTKLNNACAKAARKKEKK